MPASTWHQRLGHPGHQSFRSLVARKLISSNSFFCNNSCNVCHLGKQTRMSFLLSSNNASSPFVLIHSDVWHAHIVSNSGYRYYILFLDDHTKFSWVYLMRE